MREIILKNVGVGVIFKGETAEKDVCIVNTTPHPITMMDKDGNVVSIPKTILVTAKAVEEQVSPLFVRTKFVTTPEGEKAVESIEKAYAETGRVEQLVIVGSLVAAQAYKGRVAAMTPCPGYERVTPDEKRMNVDKFTIY